MKSAQPSLQALEIFLIVARRGSLRQAATETGLSIASVSHHLGRLETGLGLTLIDRSRRPMRPTAEGETFARRVEEGLRQIRLATQETAIGGLSELRALRIVTVEDFDSRIAPDLAVSLARVLPRVKLNLLTEPSHRALEMLQSRTVDLAIASDPDLREDPLVTQPLLRDPFVLALPRGTSHPPEAFLNGRTDLPFLRFNPRHMIGRQIDAHLRRNRISLENRYEIDSHQSIMALIAAGNGWTITTPLGYLRSQRFQADVALHKLPIAGFARHIALFSHPDLSAEIPRLIAGFLRRLLQTHAVDPAQDRHPWLGGSFHVEGAG